MDSTEITTFTSNIISFWFDEKNSKKWFDKDPIFDKIIFDKFNDILIRMRDKVNIHKIVQTNSIVNSMAIIILFDQISRNIQRLTQDKSNRASDDKIAIGLALNIIDNHDINSIKQEHFYFVILPLRHSLQKKYCEKAIELINSYHNIHDEQTWFRFKLQSYRSLYNSMSYIPLQSKLELDCADFKENFKTNITPYIDCLDDVSLNFDNFTLTVPDDEIIIKSIKHSLKFLKSKENSQKCVVISLSGGVDSMVIAHALQHLSIKLDFRVIAVHIQHSNRVEAEAEASVIEIYCHYLGIQFHKIIIGHIKRHEIKRELYELETRIIRFDFYRNIKKHFNAEYFALGHHKGDLAENVLTNLLKGRTLLDLPVMTEFDEQEGVTLWRPLLSLPKSEIIKYATKFGIVYTKNSTPEWSVRGKLRNHVIPLLNSMFNSVEDNLYKAGLESRELALNYDGIIEEEFRQIQFRKLGFYFNPDKIKTSPLSVWKQLLQKIMFHVVTKIIPDHLIMELRKLEKKVLMLNKDYMSYYNGLELIFFNCKYFNTDFDKEMVKYNIKEVNYKKFCKDELNLNNFLDGKISYKIRSNSDVEIIDLKTFYTTSLEKHSRQKINEIIPGQVLNKYWWINCDYTQTKETYEYLVVIEYQ
jgi:tRNA(Ile)-lysidine synthetase-like protein